MKLRFSVALSIVVVLLASASLRAELPVAEMQQAIERGVDYLVAHQQVDGSWPYDAKGFKGGESVGITALATLALRHANLPKGGDAVKKGISHITQHLPEPATYTAGLAEMVLFEDNPSRHAKMIGQYAWMAIYGQIRTGMQAGTWGYRLVPAPAALGPQDNPVIPAAPNGRMDHSNSQYGVLALTYAERAGYQVPQTTWRLVKTHYESCQNADGGWGYYMKGQEAEKDQHSSMSMTAASTVSLYLADEALRNKDHLQCRMVPDNPAVEHGMEWMGTRQLRGQLYAWYAMERLGILTGRSEFGGKDWMEDGAKAVLAAEWPKERGGEVVGNAYAVLFLARALEPIIINKLKRRGDWNDDPYEIKHLSEYIAGKFQHPNQWRIVTLDASVDYLLRVPILFISGHQALDFTAAEKTKLREYVNRGGTIFGMACCGQKPFDESFRSLCAELWPKEKLVPLPATHPIFMGPRPLVKPPRLEAIALGGGQGRLGVIYSPFDLCCRWHVGGSSAGATLDVGANIYFYVASTGVKLGGVKEGFRVDTTGGGKPAATEPAKPETPPAPETPAEPANPPAQPPAPENPPEQHGGEDAK